MQRTALALTALAALACGKKTDVPAHAESPIKGLERVSGEGPYLAGSTERFRAVAAEPGELSFAASGGRLSAQGAEVAWELPDAEAAELTVALKAADGTSRSQSFRFGLVRSNALAATAGAYDATTDSIAECALAFDGAGNPHIAYVNTMHPSIWWARWTGSAWQNQQVDGMGFDTGGAVSGRIGFAVASDGTPHFAYVLDASGPTGPASGPGLWYATRSGASWVRERLDGSLPYAYTSGVRLALDASRSGRPTAAYTTYSPTAGAYRIGIAYRTGANAWTAQAVANSASTCSQSHLGGLAISGGTVYVTGRTDCSNYDNWLGAWTSGATLSAAVRFTTQYSSEAPAPVALDGTRFVTMRQGEVFHVKPGASLSDAQVIASPVEYTSIDKYALAFGSRPHVALIHNGALELVTTDAAGYWTYTQLATSTGNPANVSLALDGAGAPHVCWGKQYQ